MMDVGEGPEKDKAVELTNASRRTGRFTLAAHHVFDRTLRGGPLDRSDGGAVASGERLFLMVAGAVGLGVVLVRWSSTQRESLLWALAIASERSMPLSEAALAFSDQFTGVFRRRGNHGRNAPPRQPASRGDGQPFSA